MIVFEIFNLKIKEDDHQRPETSWSFCWDKDKSVSSGESYKLELLYRGI